MIYNKLKNTCTSNRNLNVNKSCLRKYYFSYKILKEKVQVILLLDISL